MNPRRSKHDKRCHSRHCQYHADPDRVAMHEAREQAAATDARSTKPPPAVGESGRTYPPTPALSVVPGGPRRGEDVSRLGGNYRWDAAVEQTRHRCLLGAVSVETGPAYIRGAHWPPAISLGRAGGRRAARLAARHLTIARFRLAGTALRGRRFSEGWRLRSQVTTNTPGSIGGDASEQVGTAREPSGSRPLWSPWVKPAHGMMRASRGRGAS
jgi:hypothetical protein